MLDFPGTTRSMIAGPLWFVYMNIPLVFLILLGLAAPTCGQAVQSLRVGGATIQYPEGSRTDAYRFHDAYLPARGRVQRVIGGLPPDGLIIELVPSRVDLSARVHEETGYDLPAWVGGVALPDKNRVIIRLDLSASEWQRCQGILTHELSHIVLHHVLSVPGATPAPRWLDEGIAQYAEGRPFSSDTPELAMRAFFRNLIPLDELEGSFPQGEGASSLAYAEAFSFVSFMVRVAPDSQPLKDLARRMAQGLTLDDAIRAVFLSDPANLEAQWKASLRNDKSWLPRVGSQALVALFLIVAVVLGASRIVRRREHIEREWAETEEGGPAAPPTRRTLRYPPVRKLGKDEDHPEV